MAEYTLTNTAAVVDASIQKVANATTTPTDSSPLMVTSGGVKAYVDAQDTALETSIVAIEADITALQAAKIEVAKYSRIAETGYTSDSIIQLTEDSDPNNIGTVIASGAVRVGAGIYLVNLTGEFFEDDNDIYDYYDLSLRSSGTSVYTVRINETGNSIYKLVSVVYILTVPASSTKDLDLYLREVNNAYASSKNVVLTLVKLG